MDNFKHFNDSYGHAAGDAILHKLSNLFFEHVRGEDIPSRYRGDEFIIILPDASQEVTLERAELLRKHTQHLNMEFEGQPLGSITLSLGVATLQNDGTTSMAL